MWKLTGFADEAALELSDQLTLMNKLGLRHIEMRSAWATRILDFTPAQLELAKTLLDEAGVALSAVGSDLGKIQIDDDFDRHLERTKHAMEVANFFGTPNVRTFSFFMPEGSDYASYRGTVVDRLGQMVEVATGAGITLLHENEKDIYGDVPERCLDLATTFNSPNFRLTFDPANYVQCGVKPADEALPVVMPWTSYVHIKDALASDHSVVKAGEGDGQVPEVLAALRAGGYDGFLSIEPHLGDFDAFGGLCGPDLWTEAYTSLTKILESQGIEWQ